MRWARFLPATLMAAFVTALAAAPHGAHGKVQWPKWPLNPTPKPVIGRIVSSYSVDQRLWGDKGPPESWKIREGQKIQVLVGQRLELLLDDGTVALLGPGTEIVLANWTGRDSNYQRNRAIELVRGMVHVKVKKIYSPEEALLVESRYGVSAVRGTEFTAEVDEGEFFDPVRRKLVKDATRQEFELHVFEGEVYLARDRSGLRDKKRHVIVRAGQTALVRRLMDKPQAPHLFDLGVFRNYFAKNFESAPTDTVLAIHTGASNEQRATLAVNPTPASVSAERAPAAEIRAAAGEVPRSKKKKRRRHVLEESRDFEEGSRWP